MARRQGHMPSRRVPWQLALTWAFLSSSIAICGDAAASGAVPGQNRAGSMQDTTVPWRLRSRSRPLADAASEVQAEAKGGNSSSQVELRGHTRNKLIHPTVRLV